MKIESNHTCHQVLNKYRVKVNKRLFSVNSKMDTRTVRLNVFWGFFPATEAIVARHTMFTIFPIGPRNHQQTRLS